MTGEKPYKRIKHIVESFIQQWVINNKINNNIEKEVNNQIKKPRK